jgi:hypothetical protein
MDAASGGLASLMYMIVSTCILTSRKQFASLADDTGLTTSGWPWIGERLCALLMKHVSEKPKRDLS